MTAQPKAPLTQALERLATARDRMMIPWQSIQRLAETDTGPLGKAVAMFTAQVAEIDRQTDAALRAGLKLLSKQKAKPRQPKKLNSRGRVQEYHRRRRAVVPT